MEWLEFIDFSPGIMSNNLLAGGVQVTATNPCIASPTNTWRCRSIPTGGLAPLPRMKEAFTLTTPPTPTPTVPSASFYTINGLGTWGQAFPDTLADTNHDHRTEVHLLLSWVSAGTPTVHNAAWIREEIYDVNQSTRVIYSDDNALAGSLDYQYAYFLKTRMQVPPVDPVTGPVPGELIMVCVYSPPSQDLFINECQPNPATPHGTGTVELIDGRTQIYRKATSHQGRIVVGKYISYFRGVDTNNSSNENYLYTDVNINDTSLTQPQVYVPEIDQNISDLASMTANQMIVVKDLGGGYMLQGDLDDVTVVRLPNLMSPDGSPTVHGTQTPRGWVYSAGDRGLYIWNGGDQSEPISTQLDGHVFTDNSVETTGHAGSCDRWLDLLVAPQLWVNDLEQKGWWRLDDPSAYASPMTFFSTSKYRQQMYSARQKFTAGGSSGNQYAFYLWEYDDLAYTWSWQSQPLWITRDKYINTRQGNIALQGQGTVTVTLINEAGTTQANVLTINTGGAIRNFRFNTSMQAENLTVRIEASGNTGGGAGTAEAPVVHRLFLGYQTASHLPITDT